MSRLVRLGQLENLRLDCCPVTNEGLRGLRSFAQLRYLTLDATHITEDGLQHLAPCQKLVAVQVSITLSDRGARSLGQCAALECLDGNFGKQCTDQGLADLASLGRLRSITLIGSNITGEGLAHLSQMKSLESIRLIGPAVRVEGLKHLCALPKLKFLMLHRYGLNPEDLKVCGQMPALEVLSLAEGCEQVAAVLHPTRPNLRILSP